MAALIGASFQPVLGADMRVGPEPSPSSQSPDGVIGQLHSDKEGKRENDGIEPVGRHPPDQPDAGESRQDRNRKQPGRHNEVVGAQLTQEKIARKF